MSTKSLRQIVEDWRNDADMWRIAREVADEVNDRTGVLEADVKIATLELCASQLDEHLRQAHAAIEFSRN